jgi:hypothetical protein
VKVEHRHPVGIINPFPIAEWKWDAVIVYFITNLPMTVKNHDSIMVMVEKMTKATHFIPLKSAHKALGIRSK